ncbi:MAG: hypothetical protein D6719_07625 [Candidatus Dadabacteria bacterium]|nr:MAG: hypothetical protein D6719_07625 [Candidatus Dadabacteria bacterium]
MTFLGEIIKQGGYKYFPVGSLPFLSAEEALSFIINHKTIIPFWPELPLRSEKEFMLKRTEEALKSGWSGYTTDDAAGFLAFSDYIAREKPAWPLIKLQLMGPLTFLLFSKKLSGTFSEKLKLAQQVAVAQIDWQLGMLSSFDGLILIVLDDPALSECARLADSEKASLRETYTFLYVYISEKNAASGIHCCGCFVPELLSFPTDLFSLDFIVNPPDQIISSVLADGWQEFFGRNGVLAAGVYPTQCEQDHQEAITAGRNLYIRIREMCSKLSPASVLLHSATCGHAFSAEKWLNSLYAC